MVKNKSRVLWTEGMELLPQHFQQQDRFLEEVGNAALRLSKGFYWGFGFLRIDPNALGLGKINVLKAQGIFPNGQFFEVEASTQSLCLSINGDAQISKVYLASPKQKENQLFSERKCNQDQDTVSPYSTDVVEVVDHSTGDFQSAEIQVANSAYRLLTNLDNLEDFHTLQIAQITEIKADGEVCLARDFFAASLFVDSHENISQAAQQLIEIIEKKNQSFFLKISNTSTTNLMDTMLAQALNRFVVNLKSPQADFRIHPHLFFCKLRELLSEVLILTTNFDKLSSIPNYVHSDLGTSFSVAKRMLLEQLSTIGDQSIIRHDVIDLRFGLKHATIADPHLFSHSDFFLELEANMDESVLVEKLPSVMKVAPIDQITNIVAQQIGGIAIKELRTIPREIPYRPGCVYFALDQKGPYWNSLATASSIAFHLSSEFEGLSLALWSIKRKGTK